MKKNLKFSDMEAYDLMKISTIIGEEFPDMDYEDIWEHAKIIYRKWNESDLPEYGYVQEFAEDCCEEMKEEMRVKK